MRHATSMIRSLFANRELVMEMTRREIAMGQSNALLGQAWFIINPVLTIIIYVFVFGFIFQVRLGDGAQSAGIAYLVCGIVMWLTISDVMSRSTQVIRSNANLVQQIVFPVEALVFKTVFSSFSILLVMAACLVVFLAFSDTGISLIQIILVPAAIFLLLVFLIGLGLLISALTPFVPDLTEVVGVISRIGLFVAPILYTPGMFSDRIWTLFSFNPFTHFVWTFQDAFAFQNVTHPYAWLVAAALSIGTFLAGASVFRSVSNGFGDVL